MAAVGMGVFMATVDASIVNVALPTFVRIFNTQFAVVQWVMLAYLLTLATLMLSVGRVADIIGKKPVYMTGCIVFSIGSLLCGMEQTIYWLIIFRVVQALGAVMMIALGTGILTEAFPPEERGKAMGTIGAVVSIGIITGPTLGGLLIDLISWHWIFFVNVPVGIITVILIYKFVPDTIPEQGQRFDFWGAFTLFISLFSFLLSLTLGQKLGFTNRFIIILFVIWFLFFILFLYIELKVKQPMIELPLFRNTLFSLNLLTGFVSFVASAGVVLLMPFYLENVLGYNPHQVGLLLAVVPLAAGLFSPLAGILSDRLGTRLISAVGLLIILSGYLALSTLDENTTSLGYILRFFPVGMGIGVFQSPNNSAIMGVAPRQRLGVVSSLLSITRSLGQTSGIAFIGAFWASRVAFYSGVNFVQDINSAPMTAQVAGLNDTISALIVLTTFAFILGCLALLKERIKKRLLKSIKKGV